MSQNDWNERPPSEGGPQEYGPSGGGGFGPGPVFGAAPGVYSPPRYDAHGPGPGASMHYGMVPWYRRNDVNSAFVLGGFACFPPLIWVTCFIVLTGPVYMDAYDQHGQLKTWGVGNKIVAVFLILLQIFFLVVWIIGA